MEKIENGRLEHIFKIYEKTKSLLPIFWYGRKIQVVSYKKYKKKKLPRVVALELRKGCRDGRLRTQI